jgi:hypothetical protein
MALGGGELPLLYILYPCAEVAERHVIFGLTCHSAGMTAYAFTLVYNKSKTHLSLLYLPSFLRLLRLLRVLRGLNVLS